MRVNVETNETIQWLAAKDFTRKSSAAKLESRPNVYTESSVKLSRYARRIRRAKRNARSELDVANWARAGFAKLNFHIPDYLDDTERIDVNFVSHSEFTERFEQPGLPVILTGVTNDWLARENWSPQKLLERFHNEKFKVGEDDDGKTVHVQFSHFMHYCLESGDADKDDSPLYIFDPNFGDRSRNNTATEIRKSKPKPKSKSPDENRKELLSSINDSEITAKEKREISNSDNEDTRKKSKTSEITQNLAKVPENFSPAENTGKNFRLRLKISDATFVSNLATTKNIANIETEVISSFLESRPTREMLADYSPPKYFHDDLFQFTGSKRPPHRWVVIGPKRSGTGIHIDPLGTSAWNTLIFGHKRWALFPPEVPKHFVTLRGLPDHEAATWFAIVYPRLHDSSTIDATGRTLAERLGIINIIQRPGETMFVPGGWHHIVINLDFTVGVTQNFCSVAGWETVWLKTRNSRPRLAKRLLEKLECFSKDPKYISETVDDDGIGQRKTKAEVFKRLVEKAKELSFVPMLPPSSSDSSDSSSSSSSDSETDGASQDNTQSESSDGEGKCMCRRCKIRRKRKAGTLEIPPYAKVYQFREDVWVKNEDKLRKSHV
ncbi:hypothetical protein HK100_001744 [Physocladia obscura]|uniref:JmjC domain-containing protein n=1 Tax=Physocladia obscura TaxID=109957 RepID=A0AAD5T930_9FUNG|nr:hypothetical protein HK100_001744 [Physocladia obscura]